MGGRSAALGLNILSNGFDAVNSVGAESPDRTDPVVRVQVAATDDGAAYFAAERWSQPRGRDTQTGLPENVQAVV